MQKRQKRPLLHRLVEWAESYGIVELFIHILFSLLFILNIFVNYEDKLAVLICILGLIAIACSFYFKPRRGRRSREEVKSSQDEINDEAVRKLEMGENFILYLQGFYTERLFPVFWDAGQPLDLQGFISMNLQDIAPIVAIGGDSNVGVAKLRVQGENWQTVFESKARDAAAVIVRPFFTPSVLYELRWLAMHSAEKTILIMEPVSLSAVNRVDRLFTKVKLYVKRVRWQESLISLEDIWENVRNNLGDTYKLPKYDQRGAILTFKKNLKFLTVNQLRPFSGQSLIDAVDEIKKERYGGYP
jgi:hypothetical protein